jgi:hypothetical protein
MDRTAERLARVTVSVGPLGAAFNHQVNNRSEASQAADGWHAVCSQTSKRTRKGARSWPGPVLQVTVRSRTTP